MSGIFGVVAQKECAETLFCGTDYHSHLGTEYGGMAVLGDDFIRRIHNISQSQFKSKFYDEYKSMPGTKGIGVISAWEEQPVYLYSKFGPFCLVTNGLIENTQSLAQTLLRKGVSFSEFSKDTVNATELIAKLINEGETIVDGIEHVFNQIEGSCSLLLLHKDGIYAARDRQGYTPLVIGRHENDWAVTTETNAFPNIHFDIVKYLGPGEIVLINEQGLLPRRRPNSTQQICTFLWIYTGFPASSYEGINVEIVRERSGRALARRDKDIEVDVISGVPDSGTGHALGYAMESKKPYRRPLVKYTPGYGRSYTPPSQETRDLIAKLKLIPIREIIKGNRIVVCEDSIVRGTQLKNFTVKKLWDAGAKQVHIRPACPPLLFPCIFNLSTRSTAELAARKAIKSLQGKDTGEIAQYIDHTSSEYKKMVEWIARDLEVTSLRYQTVDDMVEAIGLPKEKLCLYCWTGQCPGCKKTEQRSRAKTKSTAVKGKKLANQLTS